MSPSFTDQARSARTLGLVVEEVVDLGNRAVVGADRETLVTERRPSDRDAPREQVEAMCCAPCPPC